VKEALLRTYGVIDFVLIRGSDQFFSDLCILRKVAVKRGFTSEYILTPPFIPP
jgi:hypothetical protein